MLLSDFDECNLVDNNCTKGGAYCTNTAGSFKCTCQTRDFWNGMKCQGLFTLLFRLELFRPMWTSFQEVFLTIFVSVLPPCPSLSLSVPRSFSLFLLVQYSLAITIPIIRLSVCLCLSVWFSAYSFFSSVYFSICLMIRNLPAVGARRTAFFSFLVRTFNCKVGGNLPALFLKGAWYTCKALRIFNWN